MIEDLLGNDDPIVKPEPKKDQHSQAMGESSCAGDITDRPPGSTDQLDELSSDDSQPIDKSLPPHYTAEQLNTFNVDQIQKRIAEIDSTLKKLTPNYHAIEQYRLKKAVYDERQQELENTTRKRDLYMNHVRDIKQKRSKEFSKAFKEIANKLKELYRTITLGGDADLEYIDSLDPFSEGINFCVRPNKKSWKYNLNLSGGEKTLASLALIFALHYFKPSPLYIMDEIDAALDFKNVSIIANYIKNRTKNTQFLIISLRDNMYELADRLIGIYKTQNITKSIPFDPNAFDLHLTMSQAH